MKMVIGYCISLSNLWEDFQSHVNHFPARIYNTIQSSVVEISRPLTTMHTMIGIVMSRFAYWTKHHQGGRNVRVVSLIAALFAVVECERPQNAFYHEMHGLVIETLPCCNKHICSTTLHVSI